VDFHRVSRGGDHRHRHDAWLARVFSLKRYLLFSVVTFVFFSLMCAFATNLNMMIVGRALQGLTAALSFRWRSR